MICKKCGKETESKSNFCSNCGISTKKGIIIQKDSDTRNLIILICIMILIAFLIICGGSSKKDNISNKDLSSSESLYNKENNIKDTNVINENFGEGTISELQSVGFMIEEATEIQSIFYKIGINSITNIELALGEGIDKLQSFKAYANNDTKKQFYFTVENRKMFYAGFRDADLYDTSKGGVLKNIEDIHIPETSVDMDTYTSLQVKSQQVIKNYLKYPETASFSLYDNWGIGRSDDKYKIIGKVNAKNGFGVKSDMNFSIWYKKVNEEYIVEAVEIDGTRVK